MRIYNDAIESAVGVNSSTKGLLVGAAYTTLVAPINGAVFQGSIGIGTFLPSSSLDIRGNIYTNNILLNSLNGSDGGSIGASTDNGAVTIFAADSSAAGGSFVLIRGGKSPLADDSGGDVFIYGAEGNPSGSVHLAYNRFATTGSVGVGGPPSRFFDVYGVTKLRGSLFDYNDSQGVYGQILSSTGTGIAWSSVASTGVTTGTVGADQIAFGKGNNAILGISTFVYWQNKVGIGTVFPTVLLDVRGDVNISGVTTSSFSGDGRLLTNLNASNLALGTVPTARISGTYAGISSVGDLAQLSVSGITSLSAVYLRGSVRDINNSQGVLGQILSSTGAGVAWSSVASTGVTTGTVGADQIAFGQGNNSLLGVSTFVYWRNFVGIGTVFPTVLLDVRGDVSTTGITTSVAFSGEGRLLTNLNASNLASGTVPTGRITGTYAGITSVGNLDQLSVSGITSLSAVYLRGSVRDLLNSQGSLGQILVSTGTGVAWSSLASTGVTTGTVGAGQIAFGQGNNALLGVSTLTYTGLGSFGIGVANATNMLHVAGNSKLAGNVAVAEASISATNIIQITRSETVASASAGINVNYSYTALTNGSAQRPWGLFFTVTQAGNLVYTDATGPTGIEGLVINSNNGVSSGACGALFYSRNSGSGTLERSYALILNANQNTGVGTVTNSRQLEIGVGPVFTANGQGRIGIRIGAVPDLGAFTGTVAAAIQFNNSNFSPKDGLLWGSDTTLFRGYPNVLQTNSNFRAASVGVGTTATTQLHVQGNARISGIIYDSNAYGGSALGIRSQALYSYGTGTTWAPIKRSLVATLMTALTPSGIGIDTGRFIVPYDPTDGASSMNFSLKKVLFRAESASAGITTLQIIKSTGTGGFIGTNCLTSSFNFTGSAVYESTTTGFTGFGATCTSNDKLAVNILGVDATHANFTIEVILNEQ